MPVVVSEYGRVADVADAMKELRAGLANATAEVVPPALEPIDTQDRVVFAWERMVDEVIEEIGPQVADLLTEAIRRRLPWRAVSRQ